MRTKYSIKNIKYTIFGQFINIIILLVSRIVFIKMLSAEYLGLSNLFTNILTILSLTEMGFTTAMAYQLYKPISKNDIDTIRALLNYYRKIYNTIGIIIIALGLLTMPIYPFFMQSLPDIKNLNIIYLLFVINSATSYFFSYKRLLVVSDQQKYIDTFYKYLVFLIQNVIQIIVLYLTKNYILFLIVQILSTFAYNVFVSVKANKIYPYLCDNNTFEISVQDKKEIKKNVSSMFFHKFGGIILNSSDNIVISKYLGIYINGLYANYYLIISSLNSIITQLFASLVASIGNLNTLNNKEKMTSVFNKVYFANFIIYNICCCCLINLFNPFIKIWIGEQYTLNTFTVIVLVINFFIYGMRRSMMAFREATGNYSKDKYSPVAEAIINIIASIVFVKICGIAGVFIGTIISSLCTNFWLEPLVVCKESFTITIKEYMKIYFKYAMVVLISAMISIFICSFIADINILSFILKLLVSILIPLIFVIVFFKNNTNFEFLLNLIKKASKMILRK